MKFEDIKAGMTIRATELDPVSGIIVGAKSCWKAGDEFQVKKDRFGQLYIECRWSKLGHSVHELHAEATNLSHFEEVKR